jgi:hypothetical protein
MPAKKKFNWRKSEEKKTLLRDLREGTLLLDVAPKLAFNSRPEFVKLGYANWPERLKRAKEHVSSRSNRAEFDAAAVAHDRTIHPKPALNYRGEPRWEGSRAEALLKQDIDDKNHERLDAQGLYNSRSDYKDYPLRVFRGHIHQEVKSRKFRYQFAGGPIN